VTNRRHKGINSNVCEGQTPIVVHGTQDPDILEDQAHTLQAKNSGYLNAVAISENQRAEVIESDVTRAINSAGGKPGRGYQAARIGSRVRRLTPLECERLQGFPDGYTDILGASDSARYMALGNSMAVPVMRWIGERIDASDKKHAI
jgi:DNA (cytosine-5)-methyltransferase 1